MEPPQLSLGPEQAPSSARGGDEMNTAQQEHTRGEPWSVEGDEAY